MEAFGLPTGFGKQALPDKSPGNVEAGPSTEKPRGSGGRGARGIVGGGKSRGRGRGGRSSHEPQAHQPEVSELDAEGFNGGIKRPFSSSNHYATGPAVMPVFENRFEHGRGGRGQIQRGGRGRGGGRGGGGGGGGARGGGHDSTERGFFSESFCQDPWKELLDAMEAKRAQAAT